MRILLVISMILLTSCGKQVIDIQSTIPERIETDIPEKIDIVHSIDLGQFEEIFINQCVEEFPDSEELQELCVQEKIAELIAILNPTPTE